MTTQEQIAMRRDVAEACRDFARKIRLARATASSVLLDREKSEIASAALHADAAASLIFDNP